MSTAQPDGRSRGAKSARVYIVVNLGGTQTRTAVFDSTGQMLTRRAIATPRTGGPAGVIAAILDQIREAIAQHPGVVAIGVGALGPVEPRTGLIRSATTLPASAISPSARVSRMRCSCPSRSITTPTPPPSRNGSLAPAAVPATSATSPLAIITNGQLVTGRAGYAGELGRTRIL
ncbi:MAG TPA: ROK family protein, partial [Propionibacteriaceae bacterium]